MYNNVSRTALVVCLAIGALIAWAAVKYDAEQQGAGATHEKP